MLVGFQIVRPPQDAERFTSWRRQLDEEGRGVHDVCFRTLDLEALRDRMVAAGAQRRWPSAA